MWRMSEYEVVFFITALHWFGPARFSGLGRRKFIFHRLIEVCRE